MESPNNTIRPFQRISSGVPGLDTLLHGGFLRGGIYLILGPPGNGKTILTNQIGFHHAEDEGRVLYVTLLAESQSRMFGNLKPLSFFRPELISESINYLGAYQVLEKEGLLGLLKLLAEAVKKHKATMLVIDGVASAEEISGSAIAFKKFVHELNSVIGLFGCTAFLLSSLDAGVSSPEHTMVDGIIQLTFDVCGMRTLREIEIRKFRGSSHLSGRHVFTINDQGVTIFPRVETLYGRSPVQHRGTTVKRPFGIPRLDQALDGGLISGTITSLLGTAGTAKTSFGAQFLAEGIRRAERCIFFGFYESPDHLIRHAQVIGVDLQSGLKAGLLEILWQPPLEHLSDELVSHILERVRLTGAKRLFIDGIAGFRHGMVNAERLQRILVALVNELRSLDVTTLFSEEIDLFSNASTAPISDMSAVTDNIFHLCRAEREGEFRNLISVLKTREIAGPSRVLEFFIRSEGGIQVGEPGGHVEEQVKQAPAKARASRKGNRPPRKKR